MPQTIDSAASINWQRIDASATFRNKTFTGLDLSGRVLAGVDFSGSTFFACDFSNADLSHAKFDGADLYRSAFRRSILYATRFRDCNLTRCDFSESYIYGFKVAESSNVTYARFTNFRLEQQRRSSHLSVSASGTTERRIGQRIVDTAELSRESYAVNGLTYTFSDFDQAEQHMQRSQIYNRLKRLYLSNGFNEEARVCLFWERYHRTRSWYRHHTFTGERVTDSDFRNVFRRIVQTLTAYAYEQAAGYGLKPKIVLRNILITYALYVVLVLSVLYQRSDSGLLYSVSAARQQGGQLTIGQSVMKIDYTEVGKVMYFCGVSLFSLTFQYFSPYGHMVWLSSCFGLIGLLLLALLIAAVFSVLRMD